MKPEKKIFLFVALCGALYWIASLKSTLLPFFLGLLGAYTLNRPVQWLQYRGIPRGVSSFFFIACLLFFLGLGGLIFIPFIQKQLFILAKQGPVLADQVVQFVKPLLETVSVYVAVPSSVEIKQQLIGHFGSIMDLFIQCVKNLLTNGWAFANGLSLMILTPIVMFYLLKDWPLLSRSFVRLIPPRYQEKIFQCHQEIDTTLGAFLKGQMLVCFLLMAAYSLAFFFLSLPHFLWLGTVTGMLCVIPYLGLMIGFLMTILMSIVTGHPWETIMVTALVFLIIWWIEGTFISPELIGKKIGLHPVWVLFALLAFATWFGLLGLILALPLSAISGVLIRFGVKEYKHSVFYTKRVL